MGLEQRLWGVVALPFDCGESYKKKKWTEQKRKKRLKLWSIDHTISKGSGRRKCFIYLFRFFSLAHLHETVENAMQ